MEEQLKIRIMEHLSGYGYIAQRSESIAEDMIPFIFGFLEEIFEKILEESESVEIEEVSTSYIKEVIFIDKIIELKKYYGIE